MSLAPPPASLALPSAVDVRTMLVDLLGRDVIVAPAEPMGAEDLRACTVAVYVDDSMRLAAVLAIDLPLAAYAGAAIGLLPPGTAEDSVESGSLSAMLAENVVEVCNIFTGVLNRDGAPHVKLYRVHEPGDRPPSDVIAHLLALGNRLDLKADVARYGAGRMALSLTA